MADKKLVKAQQLLTELPPSGLDEVLDFLEEAVEFYQWRESLPPPKEALVPEIFQAEITKVYTRPEFRIEMKEE